MVLGEHVARARPGSCWLSGSRLGGLMGNPGAFALDTTDQPGR